MGILITTSHNGMSDHFAIICIMCVHSLMHNTPRIDFQLSCMKSTFFYIWICMNVQCTQQDDITRALLYYFIYIKIKIK